MAIETAKWWNNSLAMRIPSNLATGASVVEIREVGIEVRDSQPLICAHAAIPQFSRERLIEQFEEGKLQRHDEIDFGDPVGDECGGPEDPASEGIE